MDDYIEVTGESTLRETMAEAGAEIALAVRASRPEVALREAEQLRADCVRQLREAGLRDDELQDGGFQVWQPWYQRKKVGEEASMKILVRCDELSRLQQALSRLEPLFENQRYTIDVRMRRPRFAASDDQRDQAQRDAIASARAQAALLADAAGVRLARVVQVEQLQGLTSGSGAYGDPDWGHVAVRAGAGGGAAEAPLDPATREARVRYRVRFAIAAD